MYCINLCRFSNLCLPDQYYVIDKSFPKYSTMLFYCCHKYIGIIWGKGVLHCGALKEVNKIYHYTLL